MMMSGRRGAWARGDFSSREEVKSWSWSWAERVLESVFRDEALRGGLADEELYVAARAWRE